jgi:hypothetical protein
MVETLSELSAIQAKAFISVDFDCCSDDVARQKPKTRLRREQVGKKLGSAAATPLPTNGQIPAARIHKSSRR